MHTRNRVGAPPVRISAIVLNPPFALVAAVFAALNSLASNFDDAAADSIDDSVPFTVASALDK